MDIGNNKLERKTYILFWILIFVGLILFFEVCHPLTIFDTDDWAYVKFNRRSGGVFPSTKEWNPTRILPENMMPVAGFFGAYIIRPIIDDYVRALEISVSLFFCVTIFVYFYLIIEMLRRRFDLSISERMIITVFMIFVHFLPFVTEDRNNTHLFYAMNTTSIYYYTVSVLFNVITVCFSEIWEKTICDLDIKHHKRFFAFYFILIYLSINSNLFSSIIIAVYAFTKWIWYFADTKSIWRRCFHCILVLLMWAGSMVFEYKGDRAKTVGKTSLDFSGSFGQLLDNFRNVNVIFISGTAMLIIIASVAAIWFAEYRKSFGLILVLLGCGVMTIIFEVLLSAKTSKGYLARPEVRFSYYVYFLLALFVALIIIIRKFHRGGYAVGLITVAMSVFVIFGRYTYADVNTEMYPHNKCKEVSDYIIKQYMDAYEAGETEVEVRVPYYGETDNFPFGDYGASRISSVLWWHGMMKYKLDSVFVKDKTVNERFDL